MQGSAVAMIKNEKKQRDLMQFDKKDNKMRNFFDKGGQHWQLSNVLLRHGKSSA
jgi:hypothetical protein